MGFLTRRIEAALLALIVSVSGLMAWAAPASASVYPAGFADTTLVSGLSSPTAVAWAPDGRMFIAQKAGQVRVLPVGAQPNQSVQLLDISSHVNNYADHGLLGIAVDSSFATNHYLYLLYVYDANPINQTGPKTSRLTRVTVNSDNTASGETVLLGTSPVQPCPVAANVLDCLPADSSTHSIGTVRSDPDGTLWVGSGDGADYGGVDNLAFRTYDEQSFAGKIVHIDRNGNGLPGHAFCPADADLTHVCTKLYAKGFRNPFRFTIGPSGPQIGDVGWNSFEELDVTAGAGKNYGWPCYEAATHTPGYSADSRCSGADGRILEGGDGQRGRRAELQLRAHRFRRRDRWPQVRRDGVSERVQRQPVLRRLRRELHQAARARRVGRLERAVVRDRRERAGGHRAGAGQRRPRLLRHRQRRRQPDHLLVRQPPGPRARQADDGLLVRGSPASVPRTPSTATRPRAGARASRTASTGRSISGAARPSTR